MYERPAESVVSLNRSSLESDTFISDGLEFTLPPQSDLLVTPEGLDIERFIEMMKGSKHIQETLLHVGVIRTAVEQFAQRRFADAADGMIKQFQAQVSRIRDGLDGWNLSYRYSVSNAV